MTADMEELEWAIEHEVQDDWDYVHDNGEEFYNGITDDYQSYDYSWEYDDDITDNWYGRMYIVYMQFAFIAGPWGFVDFFFIFMNIKTNAIANKMWAGGNWLLMFNTFV